MEILQIALRNVFRNPRRTVLNLVAIGVGVMIILTMKGWIGGLSATAYGTEIDLDLLPPGEDRRGDLRCRPQ